MSPTRTAVREAVPTPRHSGPRTQVPLPEPAPRAEIPPPRIGFRPAPRQAAHPAADPRPFPRPVPAPAASASDDALLAEFTLAAPPFPHAGRRTDPVESISIDVILPDPPPPLRLPVQPRAMVPVARVALRRG